MSQCVYHKLYVMNGKGAKFPAHLEKVLVYSDKVYAEAMGNTVCLPPDVDLKNLDPETMRDEGVLAVDITDTYINVGLHIPSSNFVPLIHVPTGIAPSKETSSFFQEHGADDELMLVFNSTADAMVLLPNMVAAIKMVGKTLTYKDPLLDAKSPLLVG